MKDCCTMSEPPSLHRNWDGIWSLAICNKKGRYSLSSSPSEALQPALAFMNKSFSLTLPSKASGEVPSKSNFSIRYQMVRVRDVPRSAQWPLLLNDPTWSLPAKQSGEYPIFRRLYFGLSCPAKAESCDAKFFQSIRSRLVRLASINVPNYEPSHVPF